MARRLPIITHPDPLLRRRAVEVPAARIAAPRFQKFLDQMVATMIGADGIGLAAAQVASQDSVAVINTSHSPLFLINPKITAYSQKKEIAVEGCLSVPGMAGDVERSLQITVRALDRRGKALEFQADELLARVIQHEVDHLNGILYLDRAVRIWRQERATKIRA